jgi:hypothetical protein
MVEYKILLGALTILIGVVSYSFYFKDVFAGKTKPDGYSWLIWGVLASITFFAQIAGNGGAGAWVTAFTAVVCYLIAATAFYRGKGHIKTIDEVSLVGAAIALGLWYYTNDPLFTVVLAVIIGALGFVPTFRKAFDTPQEETAITYFLNGIKFALAILALTSFTPVTWLYPAALTALNVSLAGMLLVRRRGSNRIPVL